MKRIYKHIMLMLAAVYVLSGAHGMQATVAGRLLGKFGQHFSAAQLPKVFKKTPRQGIFPLSPYTTSMNNYGYRAFLKEQCCKIDCGAARDAERSFGKYAPSTKKWMLNRVVLQLRFMPEFEISKPILKADGLTPQEFEKELDRVTQRLHGMTYAELKSVRQGKCSAYKRYARPHGVVAMDMQNTYNKACEI